MASRAPAAFAGARGSGTDTAALTTGTSTISGRLKLARQQ